MTAPVTEQLEVEGPQTSRVEWAPVARVNLLPREIVERRRFRTVQQGLVLVVLLVLAAAGAAFWWSERQVSEARDSLAVVQAQTRRLQAEQREYAAVPATLARVDYAVGARADAMANDVLLYRYLTDLDAAAPSDVSFDSLTLQVTPPVSAAETAATPGTETSANPFGPASAVGNVSVEGISGSYPKVAAWMDALDKINGLDVTKLASATGGDGDEGITFSSSISVTEKALSHRFDRKAS